MELVEYEWHEDSETATLLYETQLPYTRPAPFDPPAPDVYAYWAHRLWWLRTQGEY